MLIKWSGTMHNVSDALTTAAIAYSCCSSNFTPLVQRNEIISHGPPTCMRNLYFASVDRREEQAVFPSNSPGNLRH